MNRTGGFRSAWRHKRWRGYLVALALSSTGDFLYSVGLVVYLVEKTGSATWLAAAVISRMVVYTVLGPIGGVIADRYDRRRLMVGLDAGRIVLMIAAGAAILADSHPSLVLVIVSLTSALTTPYRPAAVAATPLLVGEDDLVAANAAEASVGQLAWLAGPALGAAIVALADPSTAFFVNAGTFACSALLVTRLGDIGRGTRSTESDDGPSAFQQLLDGGRAIRQVPGLWALTLVLMAVLFAFGVETVVQVLVVSERLGRDAGGVGVLAACVGAGGLLAVPFSTRLGTRPDLGRLMAVSGILMGVPLALLSVTSSFVVAGGLMVIEGIGNMMFEVLFVTLLQRACPDALLGRVYALQDSGGSLAQLGGTIAAPVLIALVNLELALIVGGGSLAVACLFMIPQLQAISDRTNAERQRLAPLVDELRMLGIFGDASQSALERIARNTTTRSVEAGEAVFSEGDPADHLYVIRAGGVEVSTEADGHIRTLAPGDWFGEIGLIRNLTRTASITADTDSELLVIPGDVFLDAVNDQPRLPDPLGATLTTRLQRTHPHLVEPAA